MGSDCISSWSLLIFLFQLNWLGIYALSLVGPTRVQLLDF